MVGNDYPNICNVYDVSAEDNFIYKEYLEEDSDIEYTYQEAEDILSSQGLDFMRSEERRVGKEC